MEMGDELHVLATLPSGKSVKYPLDWRRADSMLAKRKIPVTCHNLNPNHPTFFYFY
jgi:hypothetical protein